MLIYSPYYDLIEDDDGCSDAVIIQRLQAFANEPPDSYRGYWMTLEVDQDEMDATLVVTHPHHPTTEFTYQLRGCFLSCVLELLHIRGCASLIRTLHHRYPEVRLRMAETVLGSNTKAFMSFDDVNILLTEQEQLRHCAGQMGWYLGQNGVDGVYQHLNTAHFRWFRREVVDIVCLSLPIHLTVTQERDKYVRWLDTWLHDPTWKPFLLAGLQRHHVTLCDMALTMEWYGLLEWVNNTVGDNHDEIELYW